MTTAGATRAIDADGAVTLMKRLRSDPEWFLVNALGWHPTQAALRWGYTSPLTPDQQLVALSVRDNRKTAVPAGVGVGKTKLAAGLVLWRLFSWPGTKVVTTAPGWFQVENLLWREIQSAYNNALVPLGGRLLQTELDLGPEWFAVGLSTDEPTRFQGVHAPTVMVVFDEATGVKPEIWDAAEGLAVGPHDRFLAIGNPTDPQSRFKQVCDSGRWNVIRLSCENHPNVLRDDPEIIPGAVTKEWVDEHLEDYGGRESVLARAKIFGLWPEQGDDMLISLRLVEEAQARWLLNPPKEYEWPVAAGCDVARFGDDETVIQPLYEGGRMGMPKARHGQDTMATAGELKALWDVGVHKIGLDDSGVGGGVTDRLREQGVGVLAVNNAESAYDEEHFTNRRAETYWAFRDKLRRGELALPPHVKLAADLTNIKYSYDSKARVQLESKDKIKKRLQGRSTDYGDAAVLSAWADDWAQLEEEYATVGGSTGSDGMRQMGGDMRSF